MKWRRSDAAVAEGDSPVEPAVAPKPGGKGRPTPKRNEARKARLSPAISAPPKDRKEAAARRRELRREQQEGLRSGDPAKLPPRDRGPERAYVRDLVDIRHNLATLFLPVALVYYVGIFVRVKQVQSAVSALWFAATIVILADCVILALRVNRRVKARFPGTTARVTLYALQRALMFRRFRLPKPRVRPGDAI